MGGVCNDLYHPTSITSEYCTIKVDQKQIGVERPQESQIHQFATDVGIVDKRLDPPLRARVPVPLVKINGVKVGNSRPDVLAAPIYIIGALS